MPRSSRNADLGRQFFRPIIRAQADAHFPLIGDVDLVDGIDTEKQRAQVVDHTAIRLIAQERQAVGRRLRYNRREDIADVRKARGRAIVVDGLIFDLRAGQQRMTDRTGVKLPLPAPRKAKVARTCAASLTVALLAPDCFRIAQNTVFHTTIYRITKSSQEV